MSRPSTSPPDPDDPLAVTQPLCPECEGVGHCRAEEDDLVLDFERFAAGRQQITVSYRGQHYCLRATRNGRLILNK